MTTDPVLAYAGPESTSFDVMVILYGGDAATVRGVLRNFDTSAGEAGAAFANAGPVLWIAYNGDVGQIDFVQYVEPATDRHLHRRVTKRERTSGNFNTVKLHLAADEVVVAQRAQFDPRDFGPDFAT